MAHVFALTADSGIPIFSRSVANASESPLNFAEIGALNGVHLFCSLRGARLHRAAAGNGTLVYWRVYHDAVTLTLVLLPDRYSEAAAAATAASATAAAFVQSRSQPPPTVGADAAHDGGQRAASDVAGSADARQGYDEADDYDDDYDASGDAAHETERGSSTRVGGGGGGGRSWAGSGTSSARGPARGLRVFGGHRADPGGSGGSRRRGGQIGWLMDAIFDLLVLHAGLSSLKNITISIERVKRDIRPGLAAIDALVASLLAETPDGAEPLPLTFHPPCLLPATVPHHPLLALPAAASGSGSGLQMVSAYLEAYTTRVESSYGFVVFDDCLLVGTKAFNVLPVPDRAALLLQAAFFDLCSPASGHAYSSGQTPVSEHHTPGSDRQPAAGRDLSPSGIAGEDLSGSVDAEKRRRATSTAGVRDRESGAAAEVTRFAGFVSATEAPGTSETVRNVEATRAPRAVSFESGIFLPASSPDSCNRLVVVCVGAERRLRICVLALPETELNALERRALDLAPTFPPAAVASLEANVAAWIRDSRAAIASHVHRSVAAFAFVNRRGHLLRWTTPRCSGNPTSPSTVGASAECRRPPAATVAHVQMLMLHLQYCVRLNLGGAGDGPAETVVSLATRTEPAAAGHGAPSQHQRQPQHQSQKQQQPQRTYVACYRANDACHLFAILEDLPLFAIPPVMDSLFKYLASKCY